MSTSHQFLCRPVKARRIRPIPPPLHVAVFHRVDVDVVEVPLVIEVVADQVFPIAALPDAAFAPGALSLGAGFGVGQAFGEGEFDRAPAHGEVVVARWQGPEAVHVFGEHDPGIDMEGAVMFDRLYHGAQQVDFADQQVAVPVTQADGGKK